MTDLDPQPGERTDADVSRRTMIRGAAVGGLALPLLAACGGGDSSSESEGGSSSSASSSAGAAGATVAAADVPVGSGVILPDQKLVVTQPTKGDFKAFTAVCTHQKCLVAKFVGDKIHCDCHGSEFSITDGSVEQGPADAPLAAKKVSVKGGQITVS